MRHQCYLSPSFCCFMTLQAVNWRTLRFNTTAIVYNGEFGQIPQRRQKRLDACKTGDLTPVVLTNESGRSRFGVRRDWCNGSCVIGTHSIMHESEGTPNLRYSCGFQHDGEERAIFDSMIIEENRGHRVRCPNVAQYPLSRLSITSLNHTTELKSPRPQSGQGPALLLNNRHHGKHAMTQAAETIARMTSKTISRLGTARDRLLCAMQSVPKPDQVSVSRTHGRPLSYPLNTAMPWLMLLLQCCGDKRTCVIADTTTTAYSKGRKHLEADNTVCHRQTITTA